jgi:hypothetical protein
MIDKMDTHNEDDLIEARQAGAEMLKSCSTFACFMVDGKGDLHFSASMSKSFMKTVAYATLNYPGMLDFFQGVINEMRGIIASGDDSEVEVIDKLKRNGNKV